MDEKRVENVVSFDRSSTPHATIPRQLLTVSKIEAVNERSRTIVVKQPGRATMSARIRCWPATLSLSAFYTITIVFFMACKAEQCPKENYKKEY